MGRTRADSLEPEDAPESSHVTRTGQEDFGESSANMPYGTTTEPERCSSASPASRARCSGCSSVAGIDGPREELTRTRRRSLGACYFVPSVSALGTFASDPDEY